ncbi:hypothetical protein MBLNU459_g1982t1 [Dothideomycetes sp. NU459]
MELGMSPPTSPMGAQSRKQSISNIRSPRSTSRLSVSSRPGGGANGSRASDEESKTAVKVAVRVRPPLKPTDPGYDLIPHRFRGSTCEVTSSTNLIVQSPQGKKLFTFDRVFDEDVTQEGVWSYISDSVDSFVQGYNVSILAYGQSGAGKSYTMGTAGPRDETDVAATGIVPRAAAALFERLQGSSLAKSGLRSPQRYSTAGIPALHSLSRTTSVESMKNWQLKATYVEIYNEQLRDLLIPESTPAHERPQVSIREDTKGRILPTGLTQVPINSVDDLLSALRFGSAIRQTDSTAINAQSSRSHAVFSLNLVQKKNPTPQTPRDKRLSVPIETLASEATVTIDSKLHFVDLAGSERLKNTGAQGDRAREGISINAGLASLGKVISQLSSRSGSHVSYRDSRLTRLLQDSLGGNAITYMVACVTPAEFHLSETLNTVTYAYQARAIQSRPKIQQTSDDADKAQIERLRAEVAFLREQIKHERTDQHLSPTSDRPGSRRRETELQNKLLDVQESYSALSQRHAKLISEISKARDNENEDTPTLRDAIGESAYERLKQSNSLSEAVEQTVMEYEKTIQTLESSLAKTRSSLSSSESTLMERESKIASMENLAQQLQARLQKITEREANNDDYLRDLESQIEGATSSEEKSAALIASLRKELSRVKDSENTAEEYIATLEERLAEAEQDQEIMQREMDRLEHVIERQRSIGRLDNLLAELDTIRQADPTTGLKQANGHSEEKDATEPFHDSNNNAYATQDTGDESNLAHTPASRPESRSESRLESVSTEKDSSRNGATSNTPPQEDDQAKSSPRGTVPVMQSEHEQDLAQPTPTDRALTKRSEQDDAQQKFMGDKLETITQELFDLRGEHEITVCDYDELQRKYDIALQTLARLQDAGDETPRSRESGDDEVDTFLADAGVNGIKEGGRLGSSSRSLESELSLRQQSPVSSTDEKTDTEEVGAVAGDGITGAESALPEDRNSNQELETLRRMYAEKDSTLVELSAMYAALQKRHHDALRQVEDRKSEAPPRSPSKLRPNSPMSPSFMKPSIRRKPSQDMIGTMTNSDKTTRSFASLRNIALDRFESNPDVRQNFEFHLDSIMTELHNRSERVQALDEEVASARKDMENKMAIINGLTRERSSLQASTNVDFTVVSQMQEQLMQSQHQIQSLHETHAARERELNSQIKDLETHIQQSRTAESVADEQSRETVDSNHSGHISRLQQELSDWNIKHNTAMESAKASEATLLATIAALEAHKVESAASSEKQLAMQQEHVASLDKQIEDGRIASKDQTDQIRQLEDSHAKTVQQVDEERRLRAKSDKELELHRDLVLDLENQIEAHESRIADHEATVASIKTTHAEELDSVRSQIADADQRYTERHIALEEQHKTALSNMQDELRRAKEDIEELLKDTSELVGHETHIGNFHSHLSDVVSRSRDLEDKYAHTVDEHQATKEELHAARAKSTDLENRIGELMVLHEEMQVKLAAVSDKERKSSSMVQELEEQLTSTFDTHQATSNRLSAMQNERHVQLEEAWHAKSELEKELEDSRLKISVLESQLADARHRSLNSTSRDSYNYNRDSLSPEAAAIALARPSSSTSLGLRSTTATNATTQATTALPSPPPAIPLPPIPNSPSLSSHNFSSSIDARTASPVYTASPPGTPHTAGRAFTPTPTNTLNQQQDSGLAQVVEEQDARIRTIEKHLFAEKQLTATLEEALVDLETSQNKTRQDLEGWRRRCAGLEDELVGLRKEHSHSRASLQQVEEEREMRHRAERARMALEERMMELNNGGAGANGKGKKKKGALNCF